MAAYSREINNDILIAEVKARPPLYDKKIKEYHDHNLKKVLWEEIHEKLFPDTWNGMSGSRKEYLADRVLRRWINLRTVFGRELKIMKDPLQTKRRKYVYFDQLSFLLADDEILTFKEPVNNTDVTRSSSSLDKFDDDDDSMPFPVTPVKSQKKKVKSSLTNNKEKEEKDIEDYVQYSINKLKEELAFKNRTEDNFQVESRKGPLDVDADTHLALSLVPMLRNVPGDKKIDAHIDILKVIKKYTSKIDLSTVKNEKEDESSVADDESEILSLFGSDKE